MEISIHHSCYIRCIRNHGQYLPQVKSVQTDSNILQRSRIFIVGINLNSHSVSGAEIHICTHTTVVSQEDIVAVIDGKLFIPQNRVVIKKTDSNTILLHRSLHGQPNAKPVMLIIDTGFDVSTPFDKCPVDKSIEYIPWIPFTITQLQVVNHGIFH